MPHFAEATAEFLVNPGQAVSPITGNTEHGSAAFDPTTGEALYAVYDTVDGDFKLYRTTEGYRQLVLEDDSVEEIATIVPGPFGKARNIGLTWIDGTLYATVVGVDLITANDRAGMWIYRCTAANYSTWVLHGTVQQMAPSTAASRTESLHPDKRFGGDILVHPNGVWSVSHHFMVYADTGVVDPPQIENKGGISTSSDGGVTWTQQFNIAEAGTAVDGVYDGVFQYSLFQIHNGACSFGEFGGYAYAGWKTNSAREMHFRSNDGTWTQLADMGIGGGQAFKWPWSLPGRLYAERDEALSYTEVDPALITYTSTGIDLNDYGLEDNQVAAPHFCNIRIPTSPYLIATKFGEVVGIGYVRGGWVIGRVGPTW